MCQRALWRREHAEEGRCKDGTAPYGAGVGVGRGREVRGMVQAWAGRSGRDEGEGRAVARGSPDMGRDEV